MTDPRDARARRLIAEWRSSDRMWHRSREEWLAAFRDLGFYRFNLAEPSEDHAPPPADVIRLFRGSLEDFNRNPSWTPHLEVARRYAVATGGRIWTALVPAHAILAVVHLEREEREYLVDVNDDVDVQEFA